ncbi:hypothetical protein TraAM80_05095 [Trypanosoma rangeli]|uniref:Uncharacterized protein n=1 Tax=Trypanosoma rangeli TaxID=5698 RepID=A0A422NGA6_TRYRA|nr:uncharacterized protein TraAM80_05095 [Trypanosoma rangeli]RNF04503.1 hypothetical protein TraAM80_05095 [Trypanosoma rangeli]|eukprot:RNF04503.1 hypothetical protein TraAM80_05095 [Trypanosoma rangeli]
MSTVSMAENTDSAFTDIKLERLEQLVTNINAKYGALQRQLMQSSQSQSTLWHALTLGSAAFEGKSSVPLASLSANGLLSVPTVHLSSKTTSNSPHRSSYSHERELCIAASELFQYLNGGINYRVMCMQYQTMIELLLKMLREDIQLVRQTDILPGGTLDRAHTVLSELIQESKELIIKNGVIPRSELQRMENVASKSQGKEGEATSQENTLPVAFTSNDAYNINSSTQSRSERQSIGRGHGSKHESHVTISAPTVGSDQEKPFFPLPFYTSESKFESEDIYDVETPRTSRTEEDAVNKFQASWIARPESDEALKADSNPRNRSRYHYMEELYNKLYLDEGMHMLVEMMQLVFLKEYIHADSKTGDEAFAKFKEDIDNELLPYIQSYDALVSPKMQPLLRSTYVLNCLQHHIQSNEELLKILQRIDSERDTSSVALAKMDLCDADMRPFIALLPRLSCLRSLDLSHNNIHDAGVHELCSVLEGHPSLELLDLSDNPLTDTAGAELIQLATTTTNLKVVGQQGIGFSEHTREALGSQLQKNRIACGTSFMPNQLLSGVGGFKHNELWKRTLKRRLAPLGLRGGTQPLPALMSTPSCVLSSQGTNTVVSCSVGMLRSVRLPYLTAMRGGPASGGKRVSSSSPR